MSIVIGHVPEMPRSFQGSAVGASAERFADWTAASQQLRARLARECLERAALNAHKAFISLAPPAARAAGPLGGMPFAIKDIFAHGGHRPACGLAQGADGWSPAVEGSSPLVDRLMAAGGRLVGHLTMSEIAFEPSGHNAVLGDCVNPWSPDVVTGGSSSGSAAALAAGECMLALGSDTGGSIRIPAHCSGVTALKPGRGRLPLQGAMKLSPSLDTVGPMARRASEIALAWPVLAGEAAGRSPLETIAVARDLTEAADAEVTGCVSAFAELLAELGLAVRETAAAGPVRACSEPFYAVLQYEAYRSHAGLLAPGSPVSPVTRRRLERCGRITEVSYARALAEAASLAAVYDRSVLGAADAVLMPAVPIPAPTRTAVDPTSPGFDAKVLYKLSSYTEHVNLLGLPALALPCGFDRRGCPIAAQIVGRPGTEEALLALGCALQARSDWHARIPPRLREQATPALHPDREGTIR